MTVAEILKKKKKTQVISVLPDTNALEVARKLQQEGVGAALVRSAGGELLGIISERDILYCIVEHGAEALHMSAGKLMTSAVVTCAPETNTSELMETMLSSKIRHLPVLRDDHVLGVVSIRDVMEHVITELEWAKKALGQQIIKSAAWAADED